MRLISWNVNGIRAAWEHGLSAFLDKYEADIYGGTGRLLCILAFLYQTKRLLRYTLPDEMQANKCTLWVEYPLAVFAF